MLLICFVLFFPLFFFLKSSHAGLDGLVAWRCFAGRMTAARAELAVALLFCSAG